jgi:pSer/pThr/pTyr-binding forkhead associated (FHA) protein
VIICKQCGKENGDDFNFCLGCGYDLRIQRAEMAAASAPPAAPVYPTNCPSCGALLTPGQRFCGSCGCNIDRWMAEQAGVAPPQAPPAPTPPPVAAAPPIAQVAPAQGTPVAFLVKINLDSSAGDQFPLVAGPNIIGRQTGHDLFSKDDALSPQHATFTPGPQGVHVQDMNSLNGVFVQITAPTPLQHGDMIRMGHELLRFEVFQQLQPPVAGDGTTQIAGSPMAGAWGRLQRISGPDRQTHIFLLRGPETVLGREKGDILFREDGYVSGRHARILVGAEGQYLLEDLKSSNGTFLQIRGQHTLAWNGLLLMGAQPFRVIPAG